MADHLLGLSFRGVAALRGELESIGKDADLATRRGMVKAEARLRTLTRRRMNGRPGPNKVTGDTARGVHALKPRRADAGWSGRVSAMGGERNFYVGRLEDRFPFMRPAYDEFLTEARDIFEAEWAKEWAKRGH